MVHIVNRKKTDKNKSLHVVSQQLLLPVPLQQQNCLLREMVTSQGNTSLQLDCKIWGFHTGVATDSCVLRFYLPIDMA
jgi:hypothetical protein